jgi:hypothetical protein
MTDQAPPKDVRTADLETRIAELERRVPRSAADEGGRSGVETAFWAMMHNLFP